MFYCVRHKNGGKLSSHLWFFSGFCELFNPDYTVLMDCGLKPGGTSLFNFYLAMEADKNIGGTCGFMGLKPENVYDDAGHREDGYDKKYVDSCTDFMLSWFNI
jgi:chitin synthase